ncbi:hypothetical protein Fmac_006739 [Flemingia macrophylla]|uniref:Protein dehydration-induced 19 C-terminal domain-containing protein n=1 Tax=Flemingia macrophylla TaxID=520843 RepID=A0ABD1NBG5_9FABA
MEDETSSFDLSTASRSYQSNLKSHFELFIDFDEVNGDDEFRTAYPYPFGAEDFDLLELLDHPSLAKSGICPVCTIWVGTNMVDHIAAQHGNMFKIQLKSKSYKHESYPALSFSRKGERDGLWKSFSNGSSPIVSTSKATSDPWLSFLCGASAVDEREYVQPDSSSDLSSEEILSNDKALERDVQQSLSDKDQIERAQRSKFVQGLLMSTILDPDF